MGFLSSIRILAACVCGTLSIPDDDDIDVPLENTRKDDLEVPSGREDAEDQANLPVHYFPLNRRW